MKTRLLLRLGLVVLLVLVGIGERAYNRWNIHQMQTMNSEAVSLYKQGNYDQAIVIGEKVLTRATDLLGPDSLNTASCYANLGMSYFAKEKYTQAEPAFKRVISIREKALGPNHPDLIVTLKNLAVLYRKTGQENLAVECEKRVASIGAKK
ncbi:TPA: hypothetical protein DDW35_01750 [Candidatus Sumerlaeota bacterium]|jgi:tetratricopeptide (TPR) repeat protein|nr:hypothetical protein [Candidatus Sumerlaeota bacterium]